MNKEQAKNLEVGTKLINIDTCKVGELKNIDFNFTYCCKIYEKRKDNSYWLNNLDDWYTKEQLKDILVSPLQAINLLQSDDFFDIDDKFICEYDSNLKEIVKGNRKGVFVNTEGGFILDYNNKCMKFVPYIKPFTKKDLRSGMKVKDECELEGIVLFNTSVGDIIKWENTFTLLDRYNDSLESDLYLNINKVYTLSEEEEGKLFYNYKLLWERN